MLRIFSLHLPRKGNPQHPPDLRQHAVFPRCPGGKGAELAGVLSLRRRARSGQAAGFRLSEPGAASSRAQCGGHREEPAKIAGPGAAARFLSFRARSEEHTSELQSLMRISYAVFCLKKKNKTKT